MLHGHVIELLPVLLIQPCQRLCSVILMLKQISLVGSIPLLCRPVHLSNLTLMVFLKFSNLLIQRQSGRLQRITACLLQVSQSFRVIRLHLL